MIILFRKKATYPSSTCYHPTAVVSQQPTRPYQGKVLSDRTVFPDLCLFPSLGRPRRPQQGNLSLLSSGNRAWCMLGLTLHHWHFTAAISRSRSALREVGWGLGLKWWITHHEHRPHSGEHGKISSRYSSAWTDICVHKAFRGEKRLSLLVTVSACFLKYYFNKKKKSSLPHGLQFCSVWVHVLKPARK